MTGGRLRRLPCHLPFLQSLFLFDVQEILIGVYLQLAACRLIASDDRVLMHLQAAAGPHLADTALYDMRHSAGLVVAADLNEDFLSIHNSSDAGAQRICGHLFGIIVKETGVDDPCVACKLPDAGTGCKGSAGLIERDVAVDTDTAQEQVDAAVRSDLSLISRALSFQILCETVQDIST